MLTVTLPVALRDLAVPKELRAVVAVPVLGAGLFWPWLGTPVSGPHYAMALPVRFVGLGWMSTFTYGYCLAGLAGAAGVVRFGLRRGPTRRGALAAVGWAAVGLGVLFFFATRVGDSRLLFELRSEQAQMSLVQAQFGYHTYNYPPTDAFSFPLNGTTQLLFSDLRLGWFATLAGGALLAGKPHLHRVLPRLFALPVALAGLVSVTGISCGLWAQHLKLSGIAAQRNGEPAVAISDLQRAQRFDRALTFDPDWTLSYGLAQMQEGDTVSAFADYAQAVTTEDVSSGVSATALNWYVDALDEDPTDPVIDESLRELASSDEDAGPQLLVLTSRLEDPGAAVYYTLGRYFYASGADSLSIRYLEAASAQTVSFDIKSSCLTYIALAELGLGDKALFRTDIIKAVDADPSRMDVFATEIAAGLYVPGIP